MQPTEGLTVTMDAREWNLVLQVMAKAPVPYEIVAPLLGEIHRQCEARHSPATREPTHRANGAARLNGGTTGASDDHSALRAAQPDKSAPP
jgi:hypothetical protein